MFGHRVPCRTPLTIETLTKMHIQGQIVATRENQSDPTAPNQNPITAFNAIVYAVDTLVPIVDLNQKKEFLNQRNVYCC